MTEVLLDEDKYGKLIWPKFYGPRTEVQKDKKRRFNIMLFVILVGGVIILYSLYLLIISYVSANYFGVTSAIVMLIIFLVSVFYWYLKKRAFNRLPISIMTANGELEWDLYENGIIIRYYDDKQPGNLLKEFLPFDDIAKIYYYKNKEDAAKILALIADSDRIIVKNWNAANYIMNASWEQFITNTIWLADVYGKLIKHQLFTDHVEDIDRFMMILRQKGKSVE